MKSLNTTLKNETFICFAVLINVLALNTLRPRQNGRHFADDIYKCIFLNENVWDSIKIPMKLVHKDPNNSIPSLVQIMAWRRPGDRPLSEPIMVRLPTQICVARPQGVNVSIRILRWYMQLQFSINPPVAQTGKFRKKNSQYYVFWCLGPPFESSRH